MNIFILSNQHDPEKHFMESASYHCDKHVVKMITESTQLSVTSLSYHSNYSAAIGLVAAKYFDSAPCKPLSASMTKHPCAVWACQSIENLAYISRLALALSVEHQYRYPLSTPHIYNGWLSVLCRYINNRFNPALPATFTLAIKDKSVSGKLVSLEEACSIYRDYYFEDKASFATWKRRNKPGWFLVRELASQLDEFKSF
jgi:hypothetical protein